MKIIAVLPARLESQRLPKKVLLDINGKPMIQHVYDAVKGVEKISEIYVATDNFEIKEVCEKFGASVIMTSSKHECGTDRIIEAVSDIDFDYVINIQADEPLIRSDHLNPILQYLSQNQSIEILTPFVLNSDIDDFVDSNKVKLVSDKNNRVLYFSRNGIPFDRAKRFGGSFKQHVGLYAFEKSVLNRISNCESFTLEQIERLEQLRWLENGISIHTIEIPQGLIGVDTESDLLRVTSLLGSK